MDNRLLRIDEVALALGVSRSYAYELTRNGQIPTVKLGRSVRVRSQDLERFITENLEGTHRNDVFNQSSEQKPNQVG